MKRKLRRPREGDCQGQLQRGVSGSEQVRRQSHRVGRCKRKHTRYREDGITASRTLHRHISQQSSAHLISASPYPHLSKTRVVRLVDNGIQAIAGENALAAIRVLTGRVGGLRVPGHRKCVDAACEGRVGFGKIGLGRAAEVKRLHDGGAGIHGGVCAGQGGGQGVSAIRACFGGIEAGELDGAGSIRGHHGRHQT